MILGFFIIILVSVVVGRRRDWIDVVDTVAVPTLSMKQKAQLEKFEDKSIFAKVWADAGIKLHKDFEKIQAKTHPLRHHRKHKKVIRKIVYVDDNNTY